MKAYVCDRCGKIMILDDPYYPPKGSYRLSGDDKDLCLDFCENCAKDITSALRREVGEE